MDTLANSEDPDKMPQYAAFYKDLHYLLRLKQSSEKEIYVFESIAGGPSIYAMDHPNLTVSNVMGKFH